GRMMTLYEVVQEIARRLIRIFLRDERGRRPVHGGGVKVQEDPHRGDLNLFYEYFNRDDGAGIGASHQTGWTALVVALIEGSDGLDRERLLAEGPQAAMIGSWVTAGRAPTLRSRPDHLRTVSRGRGR